MAITYQSAGSYYPPPGTIAKQFSSGETFVEIQSELLGMPIPVAGQTIRDLNRMGKFDVNKTTIYSRAVPIPHGLDVEEQLTYIFDTYLGNFNRYAPADKLVAAVPAVTASLDLIHQQLRLDVLILVMQKKGYYPEVVTTESMMARPVHIGARAIDSYTGIDTDPKKGTFKCEQEGLIKIMDEDDPENESKYKYFKMKTIISGTQEDLQLKNSEKLDIKVAYTKEHRTVEGARKDNYLGTKAGGYYDYQSHIS